MSLCGHLDEPIHLVDFRRIPQVRLETARELRLDTVNCTITGNVAPVIANTLKKNTPTIYSIDKRVKKFISFLSALYWDGGRAFAQMPPKRSLFTLLFIFVSPVGVCSHIESVFILVYNNSITVLKSLSYSNKHTGQTVPPRQHVERRKRLQIKNRRY